MICKYLISTVHRPKLNQATTSRAKLRKPRRGLREYGLKFYADDNTYQTNKLAQYNCTVLVLIISRKMTRQVSLLVSIMAFLEDWVLVAALSLGLLTYFSNINISFLINVCVVFMAFLFRGIRRDFYKKRIFTFIISLLLLLLLVLSYFTQIDVCVRQNNESKVLIRFVPLYAVNGAYEEPRLLEQQDKIKNVDFVVYERQIWAKPPKSAIMLSIPRIIK